MAWVLDDVFCPFGAEIFQKIYDGWCIEVLSFWVNKSVSVRFRFMGLKILVVALSPFSIADTH